MFDMINNGGHGNGNAVGTEEGTQAESYDIEGQSFFDVPPTNYTAFYADGQGEDESGEDDADSDGDVPEDATATGTDPVAKKKKKISKRTAGYTPKGDVCLCRSHQFELKLHYRLQGRPRAPVAHRRGKVDQVLQGGPYVYVGRRGGTPHPLPWNTLGPNGTKPYICHDPLMMYMEANSHIIGRK
jgi:hypothetical protein